MSDPKRAPLPIDAVLPQVVSHLGCAKKAVLCAPPGAGKTTRVPLALLDSGRFAGKIIMLEPRRLAARAAAERLASELGSKVGERVGYVMRGANTSSSSTRIDVVTEGVLTRMIQGDPELTGVSAVLFDEFHERSLNADLGLALCLEVQSALREDLHVLVMSATLDAEPISALMDNAPIITSEGRSFPVETVFLPRPLPAKTRTEPAMADLIETALQDTEGGVLAFLPGEAEIRRCAQMLEPRLPATTRLHMLYGALPFAAQHAAVAPEPDGTRKLVLATSIAETSLTIEGITAVVDSGRARRARFDPGSGMSRLVTERVSRAEATQRAGRAGRMAPGKAYKLWAAAENGGLAAFPPVEITSADLSGLALELAQWGAQAEDLPFLTQPPEGHLAEARALLTMLGALEGGGRLTAHGRKIAKVPLHPRLAHMLLSGGTDAAPLAALLNTRVPRGTQDGVDVESVLKAWRARRMPGEVRKSLDREKDRLARLATPNKQPLSTGALLSLAYPDRIAKRRKGDAPRYVMSGGRGAALPQNDALAGVPYLVICDTDGDARDARVRLAAQIDATDIWDVHEDRIKRVQQCSWSQKTKRVEARLQSRLGSVILDDVIWKDAQASDVASAMIEGIRQNGLALSGAALRFCTRATLVRAVHPDLPSFEEADLLADAQDWLAPYLKGCRSLADFRKLDVLDALRARLDWDQMRRVDEAAPAHHVTPLGRKIPVDYAADAPQIEVRLQEMFGTVTHPSVAGQPLRVVLLSPAGRPVQTTMDLPGFWDSSYADVRKDMRGRYPKHPWPEDPKAADPTLRAKRRR